MDGQLPSGTLARVAHARQHFLGTSIWRCRKRKSVAVKKFRKASLDAPDDRQALEAPDTAS